MAGGLKVPSSDDRANQSESGQVASFQALSPPLSAGAPALHLATLGRFVLMSSAGQTLLAAGKPLALLAYLYSLPGRNASRDHLVHTLWGDVDEERGRHALRQTVWQLRRLLGDSAFTVTVGAITLSIRLRSDVDDFLAAIDNNAPEAAISIYGGDFLANFVAPGAIGFEHWAESERHRLRLLFLRCAESVARAHLSNGKPRLARDLATRMRDADPHDETGWRLLLEAAIDGGDRVTAHAEATRLTDFLIAEGREPEPATRKLLSRARAELANVTDQSGDVLVVDLIGRDREFATLAAGLRRARQGTAECIELIAPAGFGKTRLLRDFARHSSAAGTAVAYVRTVPGDRDIAWTYAGELVRQLVELPGALGVSPATAAALVGLDTSLSARWPAAQREGSSEADAFRHRIAAIEELILTVCEEQTTALLLDDLHWADATSVSALDHAIGRLHATPLLTVAAFRSGTAVTFSTSQSSMHLDPLDDRDTEALVSSLGELPASMPADFIRQLRSAAHGSPLLILETLKLALDAGCLTLSGDGWSCRNPAELRHMLAEGSAISRRITRLVDGERGLLLLLTIAEGPLSTEALTAAAEGCGFDETAALVRLEHAGLALRTGRSWVVAHDEIAARVRERATNAEIAQAHATLGDVLSMGDAPLSVLRRAARHLRDAGLAARLTAIAERRVRAARAVRDNRNALALVAELLGADIGDPGVRSVHRRLPFGLRVRRLRLLAATAVIVATGLTFGGVYALTPRTVYDPQLVVATWERETGGAWRMRRRQLTAADVSGSAASLSSIAASPLVAPDRPRGALRPGLHHVMATTRSFSDSGGEDVVLVSGQSTKRLTAIRGDDVAGSWSPDGRYLVIQTDRWSSRSMSDLAIIDPNDGASLVRRLTHGAFARDLWPLWSPDGSRIAFLRAHYEPGMAEGRSLCVVSANADDLTCATVPGYTAHHVAAWASPLELVGVFKGTDGAARILILELDTGAHREIAESAGGMFQSHAPGWIVCFCRRNRSEPFQLLLIPAHEPERAIRLEPSDPPVETALFAGSGLRRYLDRLDIHGNDIRVAAGAEHRLRLSAWDGERRPMSPTGLRWSSADTTIAVVDVNGIVRARRSGRAMIRVTAGGWRSDSVLLHVTPGGIQTIVEEDWSDGFLERWVPFGEPRPSLDTQASAGVRVLLPNGDSTFESGVYLRRPLPTVDGFGVELTFSSPITSRSWQQLSVKLASGSPGHLRSWDHRTGHLPLADDVWRSCALFYPNAGARDEMEVLAGVSRAVPVPSNTAAGGWVTVRAQIFQDGRCGVAVNGQPLLLLDRSIPMADTALAVIAAYSHHTRIAIGRVTVWLGVRHDIDWRRASDNARHLSSLRVYR